MTTRVTADALLVVHFAFVAFVVLGLPLIWIGAAAHWRWVRNFWFRASHLAAIGVVAIETILGIACPLTVWEDALRGRSHEVSFVSRLLHRVLFYAFPEWVFALTYVLFAAVVAGTYWLVPPERRR